jgi:predicted DNA-binding protein (MmcQ/YjbR family)
MNRQQLFAWVNQQYQVEPDYPWKTNPEYAVLRHPRHRKWFAVVFPLESHKLGLPDGAVVQVMNIKTRPELSGSLRQQAGIYPAWHMNKEHWLSLTLADGLPDEEIFALLDDSFSLTF